MYRYGGIQKQRQIYVLCVWFFLLFTSITVNHNHFGSECLTRCSTFSFVLLSFIVPVPLNVRWVRSKDYFSTFVNHLLQTTSPMKTVCNISNLSKYVTKRNIKQLNFIYIKSLAFETFCTLLKIWTLYQIWIKSRAFTYYLMCISYMFCQRTSRKCNKIYIKHNILLLVVY